MAAAVVFVKQLEPMRNFYERCFGMSPVECDGDDFCVLASDGWDLSLVALPPASAARVVIADPPTRREQTPVKLSFEVVGLDGIGSVVTGAGGQVDAIESAWTFRGYRHLDCLDPEGNVVQLRERILQE